VLIRADRLVRYKDFMAVVNDLQTNGYYKVALIAEELGTT
jgi:biopolymer transport protein ExbD